MAGVVNKIKDALHAHGDHSEADGIRNHHHSHTANTTDPRAESDRDNPRTIGNSTSSGGYTNGSSASPDSDDRSAPIAAGPYRLETTGKADARADSERDGTRDMGTYPSGEKADGGDGGTQFSVDGVKNPKDAAHVPPSVLRKHVGEVSIEHGDNAHQRERRNSRTSHQDQLSGI